MVDLVENFPVLKGIVMAEHNFVQGLQAASGFPEDQLKTVLCMLAAYPIAFIFKVGNIGGKRKCCDDAKEKKCRTLNFLYTMQKGRPICISTFLWGGERRREVSWGVRLTLS
jgi:hypothetical protein